MGKKVLHAAKDKIGNYSKKTPRVATGYVFGAHAEEDAIRKKDKRLQETKDQCAQVLEKWTKFVQEYNLPFNNMGPGCAIPDHTIIKEFIRFYIHNTDGRICENGRPVMKTVICCAEKLFGGFEEELRIVIVEDDRSEIFNWIRKTLTAEEGLIEDVKSPSLSFTKRDFLRTVSSLWQSDHPRFMPGLLKVTILLTLQLYLFTGARIAAFVPAHKKKKERGLRYEHIELVLFPSSKAPWKVGWKVNQIWLKNNRNAKYTVFGIGIRDTKKPQFAAGYILLALALNHGALFGIDSVEDLAQFDLTNGPIPLRWKDEYLQKPVLRHVTAAGPQEIPLTKTTFCECLRVIFTAAGYVKRPTVHNIRKYLGKQIEGTHGSALVSQIYGHKDGGTYAKDYVLHCSSIDTVAAVLDEDPASDGGPEHIEYFQGFDRFYERDLPGSLPAEAEHKILNAPELLAIRDRIKQFRLQSDSMPLVLSETKRYKKLLLSYRLSALKEYQCRWVKETRDQRILNRGRYEAPALEKDVCTQSLGLIMPKSARIAAMMSCTEELSFERMLLFVEDLRKHCARDFDVVYLPGEYPVQGCCPSTDCRRLMSSLPKMERSTHIHRCTQRRRATDLNVPEDCLRYCYECMEWLLVNEWTNHFQDHFQSWSTRHCEVITYRHTVIRPGYCPFCLWGTGVSAKSQCRYWLRNDNLRDHVEDQHLRDLRFPTTEPVCGCSEVFQNELELRHHLHDIHGLNKSIWLHRGISKKRKRSINGDEGKTTVITDDERDKKIRFSHLPSAFDSKIEAPRDTSISVDAWQLSTVIPGDQSERLNPDEQPKNWDRSTSVAHCLSEASSFKKSPATNTGIELIDPQILHPVNKMDQLQKTDETFPRPNAQMGTDDGKSIISSAPTAMDSSLVTESTIGPESDKLNRSLAAAHQDDESAPDIPHSVLNGEMRRSLLNTDDPYWTHHGSSSDVGNLKGEWGRESCLSPKNHPCRSAKPQQEKNSTGHDQLHLDTVMKSPQTRTLKRARSNRDVPDCASEDKKRMRLNAKERQKLCKLKSQSFTFRQIGHQFPSVDQVVLRQAWADSRPCQRLTRSRAKAKR